MTPTPEILRSQFFHLLWAEFLKPLSLGAAVVPGQMSVENLYQRESPRSYVLMAAEWREGREVAGVVVVVAVVVCCW